VVVSLLVLVRLVTYHLTNEATASSNVRKKFYVIPAG